MNPKAYLLLLALPVAGVESIEPETRYASGESWSIVSETGWTLEVVELEMLRDGEPVEPRGERERPGVEEERHIEWVETISEEDEGRPIAVQRTFEAASASRSRGDGPGLDVTSPLEGVTLELRDDDDGVEVSVVDGRTPAAQHLEGHEIGLALDALLPDHAVEVGDEWDIEGEDVVRALGLDVDKVLFPPSALEPEERDGEEERRGRGGRFANRGSLAHDLARVDWEGTATLAADDDELDGDRCLRIEIELDGSGSFEETLEREGSDRRPGGSALVTTEVDVDLEGDLLFALDEERPALLRLEGDVSVERRMERSGGPRSFEVNVTQEGDYSHSTYIRQAE